MISAPPTDERGLVWIVEDSPLEAEMTRRAVSASHDAEVFADAAAVLERLAGSALPDIVMLDLVLPGVSGLDACRSIRERWDPMALPVLILTMHPRGEPMLEALQAGANDYLSKPFDPRELLARATGLVRTTRLHRAHARRTKQIALAADVGLAITEATLEEVAERVIARIASHVGSRGVALSVARHGRFEVVSSRGDARAARASMENQGSEQIVVLPFVLKGTVVGNLAVLVEPASAAEVAIALAPLAHLLAVAVARSSAEAERNSLLEGEMRARTAAETANRTKDEFLAVLSHELRTPLNAIVGWTNLLRTGRLPPERFNDALEKVERNALSQAQLIDDLLDISRIITGKMTFRRVDVDVGAVARAALASVELAASRKGVAIDVELVDKAWVLGDDARVQQVVWNLLSNAVRFTPRGGRVTLRVAKNAESVEISVRDTGQGIDPEFLAHVFERFTQANTTKARAHGGLGLGLAIVRQLVELHGGTVEAKSEGVGTGATFVVALPIHQRTAAAEAAQTGEPALSRSQLEGLFILVVDDEPDARELVAALLEVNGAQVSIACSAAEAFELVRQRDYHAVVSDVGMPDEDGLSLLRRIRASSTRERSVPAIALTAYARDEERAQAFAAGFNAHVTKPLDADKLLFAINQVVARS